MERSFERNLLISLALGGLLFLAGAGVVFFLFRTPAPEPAPPGGAPPVESAEGADPGTGGVGPVDGSPEGPSDPGAAGETELVSAVEEEERPPGPLSIHGKVLDTRGKGVPAAKIFVVHSGRWSEAVADVMVDLDRVQDPAEGLRFLRARVLERSGEIGRTVSGDDGSYAFHGLAPGDHRLFAIHLDHLPRFDLRALVEEGAPTRLDVEMVRGHVISGRIVDAGGAPVEGAVVQGRPSSAGTGKGLGQILSLFTGMVDGRVMVDREPASSAADGSFRLRPLEPVNYDLTVRAENFAPSTTHRVPAGTEDVVIVLSPGLVVTARVLDPRGEPVSDVEWLLKPAREVGKPRSPLDLARMEIDLLGENERRGKTGGDGRLEIGGLGDGDFDLTLEAPGYPLVEYEVKLRGASHDLGDIGLERPRSISGTLRDPDGRPVAGGRVWIPKPGQDRADALVLAGAAPMIVETESDETGRFVLEPLPRGAFELHGSLDGYVDGVTENVEAGSRGVEIRLRRGHDLRGRVLDGQDQSPVAGVRVTVTAPKIERTETDEEGNFEFRGLSTEGARRVPGSGSDAQLFVQAFHPDYQRSFTFAKLGPDSASRPVQIVLARKQEISGFVVDGSGQPVKNARLALEIPGVPEFMLMMGRGGGSAARFSGEDGFFSVPLPGQNFGDMGEKLEVVATHAGFATGRYPVGDLVQKGEPLPEIEIVLTPGVSIEGRVTDTTGQPLGGARIGISRVVPLSGEAFLIQMMVPRKPARLVYSQSDGSYRVPGVEAGNYSLEAVALGHGSHRAPIVVGEETVQHDIALGPGGTLEGHVLDTAGEPLPGVEVVAFPELEQSGGDDRVDGMVEELRRVSGRGSAQARTDGEGHYELTHLPEGAFTVIARARGFAPGEAGPVPRGEPVPEIVLERAAGLRGLVTGADTGRPVTEFRVQVRRSRETEGSDPLERMPPEGVANDAGTFRRDDLRPGHYDIGVEAEGYVPLLKERVPLAEGENREIHLVLDRGLHVRGAVLVAETGEPIPGASLHASRRSPAEAHPDQRMRELGFWNTGGASRTGEDGRGVVDTLTEGSYVLSASHPDYYARERSSVEFEMPAADGREFQFQLSPAGRLRGTISNLTDADFRTVQYRLVIQRLEKESSRRSAVKSPGAAEEKPPAPRRPALQEIWIHPEDGRYSRSSLPPGTYTVALKRQVFRMEKDQEGNDRIVAGEPPREPVPIGTVEIRAGETTTLDHHAGDR